MVHRSGRVVVRWLMLALPLGLGALAAWFGEGCSNLVSPLSSDSGINPEDGSPLGEGDGQVILLSDGGVGVDAADAAEAGADCPAENAGLGAPLDIECTGLYADFATKTLATGVQAYTPALAMWADGATVNRYVLLPSGQKIDATDVNEWQFPVGTKFWQEFLIAGTRVETRWYWKRGQNDWVRGPYAWATDGASSAQYTTTGVTNVGGTSYDIPPVDDCDTCHLGRIDRVLGFEAVSLAQSSATGVTLASLVSSGAISPAPSGSLAIPDDGTGFAAPALGWLHANCGTSCHNASAAANASDTGPFLRLEISASDAGVSLGDVYHTATYVSSVNVTPQLAPFNAEGWHDITPNDPFDGGIGTSLIPYAAGNRGVAEVQMPPIDTQVPDVNDVNALRAWIQHGMFPAGTF